MFWKKKKSDFSFVKFSHGTAKENPYMIIREYDRIIRDIELEILKIKDNDYSIEFHFDDLFVGLDGGCNSFFIDVSRAFAHPEYVEPRLCKFNIEKDVVITILNELINTDKELVERLSFLEQKKMQVRGELEYFKWKYKH